MADDSVKTNSEDSTAAETPQEDNLETTTAGDGNLPINNGGKDPASSSPAVVPVSTPGETPIVVTESEVNKVTPETTLNSVPTPTSPAMPAEGLADQVESLSGEIQALEAKIDRLTGNVKPSTDETASSTESKKPTEPPSEPMLKPVITPATPPPPPPAKTETKTVSVNDIYSKGTKPVFPAKDETDFHLPQGADMAEEVTSGSSLGSIGEVLSVIGVLIFILMVAFPFYKSFFSADLANTIKTVGWPTILVALVLGFLLSLFGKGKTASKILVGILAVLAVILYLGVAGYQKWLGPLGPMLDSIFSFYR